MNPVRGVVRKIDHLGRIVIPVEIRRVFGIVPGDELDISLSPAGEGVLVSKVQHACVFCKGTDALAEFQDKLVCSVCRKDIAASLPISS